MKRGRTIGLLTTVAVALLAFFAAPASAVKVTAEGSAAAYTSTIKATNDTSLVLHGVVDVLCNTSTIEGKVESHGGVGVPASGNVSKLTFTNCDQHVTVIKPGSLAVHHITGTNDGTLTSSGAEVTVLFTTIFGNIDCPFVTNNTHIGRLTGASTPTGFGTLDIDSASIQVKPGSSFLCGSSAEWTGSYNVNTPPGLKVDAS